MSLSHSPQIITNGLVFAYDMANTMKSWLGQPTTNLVNDSMSIYNNTPSDVTVTLTATSEKYRGATVYKQVITPITATGVSYLTNGNNPGIGVISNGGGGLANRYTGHAIFYKPTGAMHSIPLFTGYSNIPGWGVGTVVANKSVAVGDGWYRGEVVWYDTVTRADGKYWAINPAGVTINVPIVVYWAAPFKEDRNDSTMVAQYTVSSRSNTQSIVDLTGNSTITTSSLTYNSDGTFGFNGTSNYIDTGINIPNTTNFTLSFFVRPSDTQVQYAGIVGNHSDNFTGIYCQQNNTTLNNYQWGFGNGTVWTPECRFNLVSNTWHHVALVKETSRTVAYVNSAEIAASNSTNVASLGAYNISFGRDYTSGRFFNGSVSTGQIYNRALSAAEVKQNFNALRGRYGI